MKGGDWWRTCEFEVRLPAEGRTQGKFDLKQQAMLRARGGVNEVSHTQEVVLGLRNLRVTGGRGVASVIHRNGMNDESVEDAVRT